MASHRRPHIAFRLGRYLTISLVILVVGGCGLKLSDIPFVGSADEVIALPETIGSLEARPGIRRSGHSKPVLSLEILPQKESPKLLSVDTDGVILLWNLSAGTATEMLDLQGTFDQAAFFPERGMLAISKVGVIEIYNLVNGKKLWWISRLRSRVTALAFQSDAKALIVGGADGKVYRWKFLQELDAQTVEEREKSLERYAGHSSVVSSLVAHPFGRAFFTGDWKGVLFAWLPYDADGFDARYAENLFGGRFFSKESIAIRGDRALDQGVAVLRISRDGLRIVIGTQDGFLEVWRVKGFKKIARFEAHRGLVYDVAVNDDGTEIVSVGRDEKMHWYKVEKDKKFELSADALEYKLSEMATYSLPQASLVKLRDPSHVISAKEDGSLVEVSLTESLTHKLEEDKRPSVDVEDSHDTKDSDY